MELTAELDAPCPPDRLFGWVDDLDRYPEWLSIVHRAEREAASSVPAWTIDLRARVGPLSRAKRLRMERTEHRHPSVVTFERTERDGREHGVWVLRAEVTTLHDRSHLSMNLRYDGRWWGASLGGLLAEEIERSRRRLLELVSA